MLNRVAREELDPNMITHLEGVGRKLVEDLSLS